MKHIIWVLIILLFACSTESNSTQEKTTLIDNVKIKDSIKVEQKVNVSQINTEEELTKDKSDEFLNFYEKLTNAIYQSNLDAVNERINPDGLYFIETNGAMPIIQKVFDVKAYSKKNIRTTFFNLGFTGIKDQPIFDSLPIVICAGEIFNKFGCFAEASNPLKESGVWNYSDLNEKEIQTIENAVKNISVTVRNTQNFTYYFSETIQGWKLTFIDIRTPCQA